MCFCLGMYRQTSSCGDTSLEVERDSNVTLVGGGSKATIQEEVRICEGVVYTIDDVLIPCPAPKKGDDSSTSPPESGSTPKSGENGDTQSVLFM